MDEFFKKRLSNHSESEDGWNLPDDQLWKDVQSHLPKPKDKRRAFIWLWGLGLVVALNAGGYMVLQTEAKLEAVAEVESMSDPVKDLVIKPNSNPIKGNQGAIAEENESTTNAKIIDQNISNSESNVSSELYSSTQTITKDKKQIIETSTQLSILESTEDIPIIREGTLKINPGTMTSRELNKDITSAVGIDAGRMVIDVDPVSMLSVALLSNTSALTLPFFFNNRIWEDVNLETAGTKKWEIGLTYSDYIGTAVPYTTFLEEDVNPMDFVRAESSYAGISFYASKRMGKQKKWSWNTGFMYSRQNIDLTIREAKIWDGRQLSRPNARTKIFPNIIDSQLYPGVVLVDGETLSLNGTLNGIGLKSLRIPIGLSYHIEKVSWELMLSTGVALGVDDFGIGMGAYGIFRDGVEIGRNENGRLDGGEIVHGAITGGMSGRYYLNNNWNLGLSLNADRRVGLPSTYIRSEIGIFKRF